MPPNDGDNTNSYLVGAWTNTRWSRPAVTTLVDERYEPAPGEVIHIKIVSVPRSDRFPEGITYAFHHGTTAGETTYLRYDNAHGVHERHVGDRTERVEPFPGLGALLRRFRSEVDP